MVALSPKLRAAKMTFRTCAHTTTWQNALEAGQCDDGPTQTVL